MTAISVRVGEQAHQVPFGTSVAEVFVQVGIDASDVVLASLNNHLVSLSARLEGTAELVPITVDMPAGVAAMQRAATLTFQAAFTRRYPGATAGVGQSLVGGFYYELREEAPDDLDEMARLLTEDIKRLSAADVTFECRQISVEAAESTLTDPFGTKTRLLQSWASPTVPVVSLLGFVDLQHGPLPPSTRHVMGARVIPYPPGLVLQFRGAPEELAPTAGRRLWQTYRETRDWNRRVGIATVADLNRAALDDRYAQVIRVAEAQHEKRIAGIADAVAERPEIRVICVAGPSSAGKTTFVRRLSVQLRVNGLRPVVIGLDDYFRPRTEYPKDETGESDFEALEALNLDLLDRHFAALLAGEEVRIPRFDFASGAPKPEHTWRPLRLEPRQVLLVEGIHGLNPRITASVPPERRFRVYINALTELVIDDHNRIHTADGRLLRRIVRDRRYRGTHAQDTLTRWASVHRGERKHIFPFEDEADTVFNSALVYETPVIKTFATRYLLEVPRTHPARAEAYRLFKLLELFVPVFPDHVPAISVLREFIGGSGFSY